MVRGIYNMLVIPLFLTVCVSFLLFFEYTLSGKQQAKKQTTAPQLTNSILKYLPGFLKIAASCSFVFFFYYYSQFKTTFDSFIIFNSFILMGLILSLSGDLLLIPKSNNRYFLVGIGAFALAHVAYSSAFVLLSFSLQTLLISSAITLVAGTMIYLWLKPYLHSKYQIIVPVYLCIIMIMVALGSSVAFHNQQYWIGFGSILFAISDIFVARNRFIKPEFMNRLIGLTLYYTAQIMIAYGAIMIVHY